MSKPTTAECIKSLDLLEALFIDEPQEDKPIMITSIRAKLLAAQEMAKALEYKKRSFEENLPDISYDELFKVLTAWREAGGQ